MTNCSSQNPYTRIASPLAYSGDGGATLLRQANITTQRVKLEPGTGAYAIALGLSMVDALAGDIFRLIISFPASLNPVVTVTDLTTSIAFDPVNGSGLVYQAELEFTCNGVNWDEDVRNA